MVLIIIQDYLSKDDLNYYSKIFQEFGEHHHATKYFSLLNYIVNFDYMVGRYGFNRMFEQSLDVFIFRYKIIFILRTKLLTCRCCISASNDYLTFTLT